MTCKPQQRRVTAAEAIAFVIGYDFAEMKDCRYQPTRWTSPAIYVCGDDYYAAVPTGPIRPDYADLRWEWAGAAYGKTIYRARGAA